MTPKLEKQLAGWKVWCDDDKVYTSETCRPEDVPNGVQVVMLYHRDGKTRIALAGTDRYNLPGGVVRLGSLVTTEKYREIQAKAKADLDWPKKAKPRRRRS